VQSSFAAQSIQGFIELLFRTALDALKRELQMCDISEAHHADCIGADSEFHNLIRQLFPQAKIVGHPGFHEFDSRRANNACDEVRPVPNGGPLK
jgi:hypothetical protein